MSTLPVVRLSEVLYTDVPTVARGRSVLNFLSPSRKRDSTHISPPETGTWGNPDPDAAPFAATELRVMLPSTFAVAKRAYDMVDSSAAVGVENKGKKVLLGDNRCCTLQCDCSGSQITGNKASKYDMHVFASDSSKSCSGESASTLHCDQHHCRDNFISKSAAGEAGESDCLTVVVESVLGFSTLRSLLQHRSHMRPAAVPQDRPPPEDQPCLVAGSIPPQNEVGFSQPKGDSFDAGVSEALGRLVGWLRIVTATEALRKQINLGGQYVDVSKGGQKGNGRRRAKESVFASHEIRADVAVDDEDTLAEIAMAAVGCVSGILYEVTSCTHQHDWSTFTLEPAHPATEGGALRRQADSRDSAGPTALHVRVICHPLVTIAPDIRWCLRLISQARSIARLLNANAKLSTLGGGYFLTRQIGQAIRLARAQSEVATALGNLQLAAKCRINEAYNYIWLGRYDEAQSIIVSQMVTSRAMYDDELKNLTAVADKFLRRSKKANRRLLEGGISDVNGHRNSNNPKWVKQLIDVKTDDWHRVRALPLYSSSCGEGPMGR